MISEEQASYMLKVARVCISGGIYFNNINHSERFITISIPEYIGDHKHDKDIVKNLIRIAMEDLFDRTYMIICHVREDEVWTVENYEAYNDKVYKDFENSVRRYVRY